MSWLVRLLQGLGALLAELLPTLTKIWRRPKETPYYGPDKDIDAEIDRRIRADAGLDEPGPGVAGPQSGGSLRPDCDQAPDDDDGGE